MSVETTQVLPKKLGGGPHGLGDPSDRTLRKVEREVLVPKVMRERARSEKCMDTFKDFETCAKDHGLLMVVKCRAENRAMQACMEKWYTDEPFIAECTNIYLNERSDYRRTGITKKQKEAAKQV